MQDKADRQVPQRPLGFGKPAQHEPVLAQRGPEKDRRQAEGRYQWHPAGQGLPLRVKQRPVVGGALVAAHPVQHGARHRVPARVQGSDAFRANGG
jgi:hypothetical protein